MIDYATERTSSIIMLPRTISRALRSKVKVINTYIHILLHHNHLHPYLCNHQTLKDRFVLHTGLNDKDIHVDYRSDRDRIQIKLNSTSKKLIDAKMKVKGYILYM